MDTVQQKLAALRDVYRTTLPAKAAELAGLWEAFRLNAPNADAAELLRMLHTMVGSGATLGFPQVSEAARLLEEICRQLIEQRQPPSLDEARRAAGLIARIAEAGGMALGEMPPLPVAPTRIARAERGAKRVFVVEDDAAFGEDLAAQLGYYGYSPRLLTSTTDLAAAVADDPPDALVVDMIFPEGNLAGAEALLPIQDTRIKALPVVFLSRRGDLEARLMAVRAGAKAYLVKPAEVPEIVAVLDRLTQYTQTEPFRILIVDDSASTAQYHALLLEQAGYMTRVVTNPLDALQQMEQFSPELILMDLYMPNCNGQELAALIRQQPRYTGLPIIFLSVEQDAFRQLRAMGEGGDDFLTKPVDPEHFLSTMRIRADRYRILRGLMTSDSMTGLWNHTRIKEQLDVEVARAQRNASILAVAMVDIDRFKAINDSYGHPVGDTVIKSLARLLIDRLRTTDAVGRYGGEEFLLILPETSPERAGSLLNAIRGDFSRIHHHAQGVEFAVTFSAGLAFTRGKAVTADALLAEADAALYTAKNTGRNRVVW